MGIWRDIIGKLWRKRTVQPYAAAPSQEQIANAEMILTFSSTEGWKSYSEYLHIALGEAMEHSFAALKRGDTNGVIIWLARADSIYDLLTATYNAQSIIVKSKQVILTPPRREYVSQG